MFCDKSNTICDNNIISIIDHLNKIVIKFKNHKSFEIVFQV